MSAKTTIANVLLMLAAWSALEAASVPAATPSVPTARPTQAKPLLIGNWADPTVLKDGDDYYMTHSSFEYQPGLLVWHSKDLRSWRPVCRAVVNQEGSIWAPELIKHQGRYFIYYPAAGTNLVVTADSPRGCLRGLSPFSVATTSVRPAIPWDHPQGRRRHPAAASRRARLFEVVA